MNFQSIPALESDIANLERTLRLMRELLTQLKALPGGAPTATVEPSSASTSNAGVQITALPMYPNLPGLIDRSRLTQAEAIHLVLQEAGVGLTREEILERVNGAGTKIPSVDTVSQILSRHKDRFAALGDGRWRVRGLSEAVMKTAQS